MKGPMIRLEWTRQDNQSAVNVESRERELRMWAYGRASHRQGSRNICREMGRFFRILFDVFMPRSAVVLSCELRQAERGG